LYCETVLFAVGLSAQATLTMAKTMIMTTIGIYAL